MGFLRSDVGAVSVGFVRFMRLSILRERQNQDAPRKARKCDSQVRHEEAASGGRTAAIQHFRGEGRIPRGWQHVLPAGRRPEGATMNYLRTAILLAGLTA